MDATDDSIGEVRNDSVTRQTPPVALTALRPSLSSLHRAIEIFRRRSIYRGCYAGTAGVRCHTVRWCYFIGRTPANLDSNYVAIQSNIILVKNDQRNSSVKELRQIGKDAATNGSTTPKQNNNYLYKLLW